MRHGDGSHFWNAGDADPAKDFATETESIATRLNHSTLDIVARKEEKNLLLQCQMEAYAILRWS